MIGYLILKETERSRNVWRVKQTTLFKPGSENLFPIPSSTTNNIRRMSGEFLSRSSPLLLGCAPFSSNSTVQIQGRNTSQRQTENAEQVFFLNLYRRRVKAARSYLNISRIHFVPCFFVTECKRAWGTGNFQCN